MCIVIIMGTISAPSSCDHTYFTCHDGLQCIPWRWVCDGDRECSDGSDESKYLCNGVGECGGSFTMTDGILTSPSYPDEYPKNADCEYIISQSNGTYLELKFVMFGLYKNKFGYKGE